MLGKGKGKGKSKSKGKGKGGEEGKDWKRQRKLEEGDWANWGMEIEFIEEDGNDGGMQSKGRSKGKNPTAEEEAEYTMDPMKTNTLEGNFYDIFPYYFRWVVIRDDVPSMQDRSKGMLQNPAAWQSLWNRAKHESHVANSRLSQW